MFAKMEAKNPGYMELVLQAYSQSVGNAASCWHHISTLQFHEAISYHVLCPSSYHEIYSVPWYFVTISK